MSPVPVTPTTPSSRAAMQTSVTARAPSGSLKACQIIEAGAGGWPPRRVRDAAARGVAALLAAEQRSTGVRRNRGAWGQSSALRCAPAQRRRGWPADHRGE
jgi:hypothetical protein